MSSNQWEVVKSILEENIRDDIEDFEFLAFEHLNALSIEKQLGLSYVSLRDSK